MLRYFEHSQVYHPQRQLDAHGSALGRAWEDVRFQTSDGLTLHGWFFPASNSPNSRLAVLLCHGNGGNISHRLDLYDALLRTGVHVLTFDYRGYGGSDGRPSENGTYLDAAAALAWLRGRGFGAANVIVMGESLGGGVASELASREPLAGLALLSSFTSVPDLGAEFFPWLPVRWLANIRYDTRSRLPGLTMPVLIMHSRNDGIIGFHHAEKNFEAARNPKMFAELTGTHNEPLRDPERFVSAMREFLEKILSPAASPVADPQ
jgi:pimeloyl-ACP methyl ester carboxylesterase